VVVFNADGRLISANDDFHVHFWDVGSGKETFSFRGPGGLHSLAPSPDGRRIVTGAAVGDAKKGTYGHDVCVWDSATGRNLMTYRDHTDWITSVAYSPDGTQVASCSRDGTVRVLDAESGRAVHILHGHDGPVFAIAFNPAGKQLASIGNDGFVKVWNLITGQEAFPLQDPKHGGWRVAYSSDGTRLAAGGWGKATIWDTETGKYLLTLKGPSDLFGALAFSPDGHRLATSADDSKVRLWDISSGQEVFSLQPDTGGWPYFDIFLAFSPDGKRLATGRKTVMLWETTRPSAEDLRHRQITGLVEELFRGLVVKARVRKYLQEYPALDDAFRKEALAVADTYPQDARELNEASWQTVRSPMEPKRVYARALVQAEEACRLDPDNSVFLNSLGVACYRMGRYKDAKKHLEQADTLHLARDKTSQPNDLAFLAMAHHQLGQSEQSKALLAKLRTALKDDRQGKDEDAWRFLDEAEELIEGSQPAHGIQGATGAPEHQPQKK
jgi:dipeptidyl aminopeptidase/acylaminoacyl peptidase